MRIPARILLVLGSAALLIVFGGPVGCGPSGEPSGEGDWPERREPRYSVTRVHNTLVRLDLQTGQMWITPHNAAGGWRLAGEPADPDGATDDEMAAPVFSLTSLTSKLAPIGATRYVLRGNHNTGQVWLGKVSIDPEWEEIGSWRAEDLAAAEQAKQDAQALPVIPKAVMNETPPSQADIDAFVEAIEKEGLPVQVRVWATLQLGQLDPGVAVPPLLQALESNEPEVVVAAITALRNTGDASTIPLILAKKDHPDERVRAAVSQEVIAGD